MKKINIGTAPNNGTGDPLRNAFIKVNDNIDALYQVLPQNKIVGTGTLTPTFWPMGGGTTSNGIFESAVINDGIRSTQLPYKRNHLGLNTGTGNCFTTRELNVVGVKPTIISIGFWVKDSEINAVYTPATTPYQFWLFEGGAICLSGVQIANLILNIGSEVVQAFNTAGKIAGNMVFRCIDKQNGFSYITITYKDMIWAGGYNPVNLVFYFIYNNVRDAMFNKNISYTSTTVLYDVEIISSSIYPDSAGLQQYPPNLQTLQNEIVQTESDLMQEISDVDTNLQNQIDNIIGEKGLRIVKNIANQIWVRSKFNSTKDLAQLIYSGITLSFGGNPNITWGSINIIDNTVLNSALSTVTGVQVGNVQDDKIPPSYNGTYIGGNHGCSDGRRVTATAHGKTSADIGSRYTNGGFNYYIIRVVDANTLIMLGENHGTSSEKWRFRQAPTGTFVYAAGGVNTSNLTVTVSVMEQILPAIKNMVQKFYCDNIEVSPTTIEVLECKTFDIIESYDIVNLNETLNYLIANTGTTYTDAQLLTAWQYGSPQVAVNTKFQYQENGALVLTQDFKTYQEIVLGYHGYLQNSAMVNAAGYPNTKMCIPKTLPQVVGARTWDFRTLEDFNAANAPTGSIAFPKGSTWESLDNAPSRWIQFLADAGNVLKIGFAGGFTTDRGVGKIRGSLLNDAGFLFTTRKMYPYGIASNLNPFLANNLYSAVFFRQYFDAENPDFKNATSVTSHKVGNDTFYYIDYHTNTNLDVLPMPIELIGKQITIIEKSANMTLLNDIVAQEGISLKMPTGANGYLVIKISA